MKIKYTCKKIVNGISIGQRMIDTVWKNELWERRIDNWYKIKDNTPSDWDLKELDIAVKNSIRFKLI